MVNILMKSQKNGEATMSKKQSSVEWLVEKIQQANPSFKFDALKRQAKAMHRKEIEIAFAKSYLIGVEGISYDDANKASAKYYKETYGGE